MKGNQFHQTNEMYFAKNSQCVKYTETNNDAHSSYTEKNAIRYNSENKIVEKKVY